MRHEEESRIVVDGERRALRFTVDSRAHRSAQGLLGNHLEPHDVIT